MNPAGLSAGTRPEDIKAYMWGAGSDRVKNYKKRLELTIGRRTGMAFQGGALRNGTEKVTGFRQQRGGLDQKGLSYALGSNSPRGAFIDMGVDTIA